jgi:predicted transport protein
MAKSPEEMAAAMVQNCKEKTGKTLPQWLKIAKASKLAKHGELLKYLKSEHSMTHGYANLVALTALKGDQPGGGDDLVTAQYGGSKAELRPIYDALIKAIQKFGKDVEVSPKKAYVSLRRSKQFALIQPSTKTRVDVGLNLKGAKATTRLEKSGSFNSMVSHRVRISEKSEVNTELIAWLKQAYTDA